MKIRLLAPAETRLALKVLDADPVLNLGLISNITKSGLNNLGLIGQGSYLGLFEGGDLVALLCHDNQGVWRFQVNEPIELFELAGEALRQGMHPLLVLGEARLMEGLLAAMAGEMGYLKLVEDEVMLLLAGPDFRPRQDRESRYAVTADMEQVAALEEGLQRELLGPDSWRKAAVRRYAAELIQQRPTVICEADGQAVSKADLEALRQCMLEVCQELSYRIVQDAEGGTKVAHITVSGAKSNPQAELAARAIGNSPLVKTALFGCDPNWGRIIAALGRSGAEFEPGEVVLTIGGILVFQNGQPAPDDLDALLAPVMRHQDVHIELSLGQGRGAFTLLASDLTKRYVEINADYRT